MYNQHGTTSRNLPVTLLGGQSFSWRKEGDWYIGATQKRAVKLKQGSNNLIWQTYPVKDDYEWFSEYMRLDIDYDKIIKKINKDAHVAKAIQQFPGLHLLKQGFEESLFSFLCSARKSIPSIRENVYLMSQKWGETVDVDGTKVKLFPKAERLAEADISELLECKVGFRAKFIKAAAEKIVNENLTEGQFQNQDVKNSLNRLKQFLGVGDKIADCVAVYGLGHDEISPIDVWGMRYLQKYYGFGQNAKYDEMREWLRKYFEGYAAWGGQFLFEYVRGKGVKS